MLQSCNVGSQKKSSASSPEKDSLITIEDTTALSLKSEIICPKCGHKSLENMPTDVCQIKYVCKSCAAIFITNALVVFGPDSCYSIYSLLIFSCIHLCVYVLERKILPRCGKAVQTLLPKNTIKAI